MTLDKETLQRWKEDAKKATQGEWKGDTETDMWGARIYDKEDVFICESSIGNKNAENELKHIINSQPHNFLALIERLEDLEWEKGVWDKALKNYQEIFDKQQEKIERYEEALKKFYADCNHFEEMYYSTDDGEEYSVERMSERGEKTKEALERE